RRTPLTAATPALRLELFDALGVPIAAARAWCWTGEDAFVEAGPDPQGKVRFPLPILAAGKVPGTGGDGGGYVVFAHGYQPVWQALDDLDTQRRVVLGAGASVTGQVLVDGRPAGAGVELSLWHAGHDTDIPT